MVTTTHFHDDHVDAILAELNDSPLRRRKLGKYFTAWVSYLGAHEWRSIQSPALDGTAAIDILVDIIVKRLHCRNPFRGNQKECGQRRVGEGLDDGPGLLDSH